MTDAPAPDLPDLTANALTDDDGLSPMQRDFAEHALELIGKGERFWRKEAATRAGYKEPRGAAHDLIRMPKVVAYMAARMTDAAEAVKVDRSFVLFNALTSFRACEAQGDYRTAHRFLDTIAKHVDVGAFTRHASDNGNPGQPGTLTLPFDPSALSTDELATMVALMRKASHGKPTE